MFYVNRINTNFYTLTDNTEHFIAAIELSNASSGDVSVYLGGRAANACEIKKTTRTKRQSTFMLGDLDYGNSFLYGKPQPGELLVGAYTNTDGEPAICFMYLMNEIGDNADTIDVRIVAYATEVAATPGIYTCDELYEITLADGDDDIKYTLHYESDTNTYKATPQNT